MREHRWFVAVLGGAVALRVATSVAYRPLRMGTDAYGYLSLGTNFNLSDHFIVAPDRPPGYPLLLWLLDRPAGFEPDLVTTAQHLAGLVTGTLAYWLLVRLGVRRWLAVAAAAVILLDTYAIALEQTIMPEAWFSLGLMAAAALVAGGRPSVWPLLAAGAILGATASLRLAALVTIPVWVAYLVWRCHRRPALIAIGVVALAIPIAGYAAAHQSATGRLGFSDASGFFLYGRVAHLADCTRMDVPPEQRPLCQPEAERVDNPGVYIWNARRSPARRMFPGWGATAEKQARADSLVGDFARATIRSRPLAYLGLVGRDFLRFFTPGADPWGEEGNLRLPAGGSRPTGPAGRDLLGARLEARFPAPVLHALWRVLRTPRWLLGPLALLALGSIAITLAHAVRRRPPPLARGRETLLFAGMALLTLLAAAAVAQYGLRYLVAVAPLLVVAGALAIEDLTGWLSARARARGTS